MADETQRWPVGPHPGREVELDARSLRGLAHPLRVRLLGELRYHGPSTATRLAQRLGESSGATSYHLRQLAAYGFVAEAPPPAGREKGRERWWRAAHQVTRLRLAEMDTETAVLAEEFLHAVVADAAEMARRAVNELPHLPPEWRRGSTLSDFSLRLTAEELLQLKEEMLEVIARYRTDRTEEADAAPPGAQPVVVQLQAFRLPGTAVDGDPDPGGVADADGDPDADPGGVADTGQPT